MIRELGVKTGKDLPFRVISFLGEASRAGFQGTMKDMADLKKTVLIRKVLLILPSGFGIQVSSEKS